MFRCCPGGATFRRAKEKSPLRFLAYTEQISMASQYHLALKQKKLGECIDMWRKNMMLDNKLQRQNAGSLTANNTRLFVVHDDDALDKSQYFDQSQILIHNNCE